MLKEHRSKNPGIITFAESVDRFESDRQVMLAPDGDMASAAKNLFSAIRIMDAREDIDIILVSTVPNYGLGVAINDRLRRASVTD